MPEQAGAGPDTSTQTATLVAETAAPAWSLDSWKDDQWDALPERIRTVADKRYEGVYGPKLTEANTALTQHQADLAAAKKELQDARAAQLNGDPWGAKKVEEATAGLAKLQADFDGYKKEWNPERFQAHTAAVQKRWDEATTKANETFGAAVDQEVLREVMVAHPWYPAKVGEAPNPQHDTARAAVADDLFKDFGEMIDVPRGWYLVASGLNAAQRNALGQAVLSGTDPMAALRDASRPPAHTPSPASRTGPGGPRAGTPPRPDEGFRKVSPREEARRGFRASASAATGGGTLNPDR